MLYEHVSLLIVRIILLCANPVSEPVCLLGRVLRGSSPLYQLVSEPSQLPDEGDDTSEAAGGKWRVGSVKFATLAALS